MTGDPIIVTDGAFLSGDYTKASAFEVVPGPLGLAVKLDTVEKNMSVEIRDGGRAGLVHGGLISGDLRLTNPADATVPSQLALREDIGNGPWPGTLGLVLEGPGPVEVVPSPHGVHRPHLGALEAHTVTVASAAATVRGVEISAHLVVEPGATLTLDDTRLSDSWIEVHAAGVLVVDDAPVSSRGLRLDLDGTVRPAEEPLVLDATLRGSGTVDAASATINGEVAPTGSMAFTGDLTLPGTLRLGGDGHVDVAGTFDAAGGDLLLDTPMPEGLTEVLAATQITNAYPASSFAHEFIVTPSQILIYPSLTAPLTCSHVWAAPVDGDWEVPGAWLPGTVPTDEDVACLPPGDYTVTATTADVEALAIGFDGPDPQPTLRIVGGPLDSPTTDGRLRIHGAGSSNHGTLELTSATAGRLAELSFELPSWTEEQRTFANAGTLTLAEGAGGPRQISGGTFLNTGTIRSEAADAVLTGAPLPVEAEGRLVVTSTGTITVAEASTLWLQGRNGDFELDDGDEMAGAASLEQTGGTLMVDGVLRQGSAGSLTLTDVAVTGAGEVHIGADIEDQRVRALVPDLTAAGSTTAHITVDGDTELHGDVPAGVSMTVVPSGASTSVSTFGDTTIWGTVRLGGPAELGHLRMASASELVVEGTLDLAPGGFGQVVFLGGTGTLVNHGTLSGTGRIVGDLELGPDSLWELSSADVTASMRVDGDLLVDGSLAVDATTRAPSRVVATANLVGGSFSSISGVPASWISVTATTILLTRPPCFTDVPVTHPFSADIEWAAAEGLVNGFDHVTFRPTNPVSRQALATILWRQNGSPTGAPDPGFADIPADHPFHTAIAWATEEGLVNGYNDGTYRPTNPTSRQALAAILHRQSDV